MITEQALEAMGFKRYEHTGSVPYQYADFFYQARIVDKKGTKYFLNFWHFPREDQIPEGWTAESILYTESNDPWFKMEFYVYPDTKIEHIMLDVESFWDLAPCGYYEVGL